MNFRNLASLFRIYFLPYIVWLLFIALPTHSLGAEADTVNYRPPENDVELEYWLQNMVWYHRYSVEEIQLATGLTPDSINSALVRFDINASTKPDRSEDAPLLVMPFPGGRHPRIGFLEGAIDPQRDTKMSIFPPWDDTSYGVIDVPETIWIGDKIFYLAHTHINTIWDDVGIKLHKVEWTRHNDGSYEMRRKMPDSTVIGSFVIPSKTEVRFQQWITNNTQNTLRGLRVQDCLMLSMMPGFNELNDNNNVVSGGYIARHGGNQKHWVIMAFGPSGEAWTNPLVPCMHSNPTFPDCAPGETQKIRGWLSFYEGDDIQAELTRINAIGWMDDPDYQVTSTNRRLYNMSKAHAQIHFSRYSNNGLVQDQDVNLKYSILGKKIPVSGFNTVKNSIVILQP
ncbi:MAG: hypothetical protein HQK83_08445 [Fibrobacteria bacterium]|nr:hypothetical protein [Fibrobacteria bacterium]